MRRLPQLADRVVARKALGFGEHDFILCSFGLTGPIKLNHRLLQAWLESSLAVTRQTATLFSSENSMAATTGVRRIIDRAGKRIRIPAL